VEKIKMARHTREVGTFVLSNSNLQVRLRNKGQAVQMIIADAFGSTIAIIPVNNSGAINALMEGRCYRLLNGRLATWSQKAKEIARIAKSATKAKTKAKTIKANVKPKLKSVA